MSKQDCQEVTEEEGRNPEERGILEANLKKPAARGGGNREYQILLSLNG